MKRIYAVVESTMHDRAVQTIIQNYGLEKLKPTIIRDREDFEALFDKKEAALSGYEWFEIGKAESWTLLQVAMGTGPNQPSLIVTAVRNWASDADI